VVEPVFDEAIRSQYGINEEHKECIRFNDVLLILSGIWCVRIKQAKECNNKMRECAKTAFPLTPDHRHYFATNHNASCGCSVSKTCMVGV
jgi:hypothetical protein